MTNVSVAFLDQFHSAINAAIKRALPKAWDARFASSSQSADQAAAIADAEVAFVMAAHVRRDLLAAAPRLRLIQKLGAGVDRIDLETCATRGIAVAKLAAGNAIPVAEHTVLLMLAAYRRLPQMDRRTRAGEWLKEEARGINRQLFGKRIGLIGLGAIGMQVARTLAGFGVEIVYYDPGVPAPIGAQVNARSVSVDELLVTSDIVSLHLPLMSATAGFLDEQRIARMKLGAVLINCARGGLVDEAALGRALASGRLMAASLDTFAKEPPVGSPLLEMEQTVITPHMAGATLDNFALVLDRAFGNAKHYLECGQIPDSDAVFVPARAAVRNA